MIGRDLELHYRRMWEEGIENYSNGNVQLDPYLLDSINDTRLGLTIRFRPNSIFLDKLVSYQNHLKKVFPNQYYYPKEDIHMTVLTTVTCEKDFKPSHATIRGYNNLIQEEVQEQMPFYIDFKGITLSPTGPLVKGYPKDNSLNLLRNNFRVAIRESNLYSTLDIRYSLKTAHISLLRFVNEFKLSKETTRELLDMSNLELGEVKFDCLEFVVNDWYHKHSKTRIIKRFELND